MSTEKIAVQNHGISLAQNIRIFPPFSISLGSPAHGGDCSHVQAQLTDIKELRATRAAFAALKEDGSVIAWGHPRFGGDTCQVTQQLRPGWVGDGYQKTNIRNSIQLYSAGRILRTSFFFQNPNPSHLEHEFDVTLKNKKPMVGSSTLRTWYNGIMYISSKLQI